MLTINASNVIRVLRALTPRTPPEDREYRRLYHVRVVAGANLTVDIYSLNNPANGQGISQEQSGVTIPATDINDDTKYEKVTAQFYPLIVTKDTVTNAWSIFNNRFYASLGAAKSANPTLQLAIGHITDEGKIFIADPLVDIA